MGQKCEETVTVKFDFEYTFDTDDIDFDNEWVYCDGEKIKYDRLIFGYDFSDNPKIIHRYQWFIPKDHFDGIYGIIFEGSNAATPQEASNKTGTSINDQWVPLDIWGRLNYTPFKNELQKYNGIDVTSQLTNMNKEEVFKKFMQGKIPLLSLGGITLLETGTSMENE